MDSSDACFRLSCPSCCMRNWVFHQFYRDILSCLKSHSIRIYGKLEVKFQRFTQGLLFYKLKMFLFLRLPLPVYAYLSFYLWHWWVRCWVEIWLVSQIIRAVSMPFHVRSQRKNGLWNLQWLWHSVEFFLSDLSSLKCNEYFILAVRLILLIQISFVSFVVGTSFLLRFGPTRSITFTASCFSSFWF